MSEEKKIGLGRGLGSLIPQMAKNAISVSEKLDLDHEKVYQIPVDQIKRNPLQPRKEFNEHELAELAMSIRQYGIILPLVVTKISDTEYELIAGERRLRAAKLIGLETVPVILKTAKELEKLEIALIENVQRQNLNDIEKAQAYYQLMTQFGLRQKDIAKRVGQEQPTIAHMVRLLTLPQEIQQAVIDGKIRKGHAKCILAASDPKQQMEIYHKVLEHDLSIPDTAVVAKQITGKKARKMYKYMDAFFNRKREILEDYLGTHVSIRIEVKKEQREGESGYMQVKFYNKEDLQALVDKITGHKGENSGV